MKSLIGTGLVYAVGIVLVVSILLVAVAVASVGAAALGALLAAPFSAILWLAWQYSGEEVTGLHLTYTQVWAGVILLNGLRVLFTKGFAPKEVVEGTLKRLSTQ